MKVNITIMFFCSIFIASCVMNYRYPQGWSPMRPVEDSQCPDISGTYRDLGERDDKELRKISLIGLVFPKEYRSPMPTRVTIRQQGADTMEISVKAIDSSMRKLVVSRSAGEFSCTSQGIRFPLGHKVITGETFEMGIGWMSVYLNKSTDGDLVTKRAATSAGIVCLIPIVGTDYSWSRFKQIDSSDSSDSGRIGDVSSASDNFVTLAGTVGTSRSADGTGGSAKFNHPRGITIDGTNLYVTDWNNNTVREIVISTGAGEEHRGR